MGDIFEKYTPVPADEWRETKAELARLRAAAERVAAEARATALEVWRERDGARAEVERYRAGILAALDEHEATHILTRRIEELKGERDAAQARAERAEAILRDAEGVLIRAERTCRVVGCPDPVCQLMHRIRALLTAAPERGEGREP